MGTIIEFVVTLPIWLKVIAAVIITIPLGTLSGYTYAMYCPTELRKKKKEPSPAELAEEIGPRYTCGG